MSWHRGPLAAFDIETTGVSVSRDRIVSAALIHPNGQTTQWLSDLDGAEIPTAASDVGSARSPKASRSRRVGARPGHWGDRIHRLAPRPAVSRGASR